MSVFAVRVLFEFIHYMSKLYNCPCNQASLFSKYKPLCSYFSLSFIVHCIFFLSLYIAIAFNTKCIEHRIDNNYINYLIDYFLSTRNHLWVADAVFFGTKPNKNGLLFYNSIHGLFKQMTKTKWQFIARITDAQCRIRALN